MLLCMSSCDIGHSGGDLQGRVDFTNYIAFETTDDLGLAHTRPGATMHVLPCPGIMAKPDQNDAIEGGIGLPVATTVQPVPVGLSRGGRHRTRPHSEAKAASE